MNWKLKNGFCKCKKPKTNIYPNFCDKCSRLLKFYSNEEKRKCKHKNISTLGNQNLNWGCPSDPFCIDCYQRVVMFSPPVLWKDIIPCSNWDKIKHKKTINPPPYPYYEIGVFTNKKFCIAMKIKCPSKNFGKPTFTCSQIRQYCPYVKSILNR